MENKEEIEYPITILIADDHRLVREAWCFVLGTDIRFEVVAECSNAVTAIEQAKKLRPDIVLLDINMPGVNGIEAVPLIRKFSPISKILGVSLYTFPHVARKMMLEGASGYITKNSDREEMFKAILELKQGRKYLCKEIREIRYEQVSGADDPKTRLSMLSMREIQVITNVREGLTSREIADKLRLTAKTVDIHRYNILKKLKLNNAAELVNFFNAHQTEF